MSLFYLHRTRRHRSNATRFNPKSIEGFSSTLNGAQFSRGDEHGKRICLDVPRRIIKVSSDVVHAGMITAFVTAA